MYGFAPGGRYEQRASFVVGHEAQETKHQEGQPHSFEPMARKKEVAGDIPHQQEHPEHGAGDGKGTIEIFLPKLKHER